MDDENKREEGGDGRALQQVATARTIVVNGMEHRYFGDEIGAVDLVRLSHPDAGESLRTSLTIAYSGGPADASGFLPRGRTIPVIEGQTFSVSLTDKS